MLSAQELAEWHAFYDIEPWGSQAEFYRAGIPAAAILNVHRDPKKSRPVSPADFVPKIEPKSAKKALDPRVLKAKFDVVFAGRIKKDAGKDHIRNQGRKGDGKSS